MYVPVPQHSCGTDTLNMMGGMSLPNFPGNWQYVTPPKVPTVTDRTGVHMDGNENNVAAGSPSVKDDSIKKRVRRANKREADELARKQESAGLRPYVVQVSPKGIIDSGCSGHLKWQEMVRDLSPRFLDMSVIRYEEHNENLKAKLRDALRQKFDFVDYEVTDNSMDKMIKTWMRKDPERMKRLHGGKKRHRGDTRIRNGDQ